MAKNLYFYIKSNKSKLDLFNKLNENLNLKIYHNNKDKIIAKSDDIMFVLDKNTLSICFFDEKNIEFINKTKKNIYEKINEI